MNLIDIRLEIAKHLNIKDLIHFISIDKLGSSCNNLYFWKTIQDYNNIPSYPHLSININHIQLNINHYNRVDYQVKDIIYRIRYGSKININTWLGKKWISFIYLKHLLTISNINNYKFDNILLNYHLYDKYFKKLYISRTSPNKLYSFDIKFIVPTQYHSILESYSLIGFTDYELYSFLFHFIYYIDLEIIECLPLPI